MDKYIGFDIDSKKTVVCVVQKGKKDLTLLSQINAEWYSLQNCFSTGIMIIVFETGSSQGLTQDGKKRTN